MTDLKLITSKELASMSGEGYCSELKRAFAVGAEDGAEGQVDHIVTKEPTMDEDLVRAYLLGWRSTAKPPKEPEPPKPEKETA